MNNDCGGVTMGMRVLFSLALFSSLLAGANPPASETIQRNVETYRVFGPEHPGLYKHPAAITELANGDLYMAYYGGGGEYEDDTAVFGSRLKPGEAQWTPPTVIADTPDRGEGNPVVWQAPDGVVWLFYVNRYDETWSSSRIKAKISRDGAVTWSDSFMLTFEPGAMVRGQPIVLDTGEYFLPVYKETGGDRELVGEDTCSFFLRYSPDTRKWTESGRITGKANLQPQVVQLDAQHLITYMRRAGGYLPTQHGYMLRAESHDGGQTWSKAEATAFPNPNAAVDFIRLQNGHLMLVYNDNMNDRTPLTVAISKDNDKTWPHRRDIGGGDNTFAYPYAIQCQDGHILVVYTTNERTTIMMASFYEEAITAPVE